MDKETFLAILTRYLENSATPEEEDFLVTYYKLFLADADVLVLLEDKEKEKLKLSIKAGIDAHIDQPEITVKRIVWWPRIAAAASFITLLGVGGYFILHQKHQPDSQIAQNDVFPYSKQTILKTGHGKVLIVDTTHKGLLAKYVNATIQSTSNTITYTNTASESTVYDTIQVPAGGKPAILKFADGSQITVNVASALRIPENFRTAKNDVQLLSGEAYFDIVHNPKSLVLVNAKNQTVKDYGTQFDINTYDDEADSRTTLVDGLVSVNDKKLAPGEQAIITPNSMTVASANIREVTAWVKGYFRFNGENIQTVMRELARWYDIEVTYAGQPSKEGYYLKISRSMKISEVLRVLERTNSVHFKIEGRRVTVLPGK